MALTDRNSGISGGVNLKPACYVATTGANITLSSTQVIDGLVVGSSQRVLVKDQTDATENGIYVSDTSTWSRAKDFDGANDAIPGTLTYVDRGTQNGKSFWAFNSSSTATSIDIGATGDNVTVSQVTQALGVIPLTTKGDLLVYDAAATRLAIGATNTVLQSAGSTQAWGLIGSSNIVASGLSSSGLGTSAVTTAKIANAAVTGPKISISGETTGAIAYFDGSTWDVLAPGTTLQFLRGGTTPAYDTPTHPLTNMSAVELVRKSSDESVSASTTLQNDDELFISLSTGEVVAFDVTIFIDSTSGTPDFVGGFTVPSGATLYWSPTAGVSIGPANAVNQRDVITTSGDVVVWGTGTTAPRVGTISGVVANSSTTGNLQFQWAQAVSDAAAVTVKTNSFLKAHRLS